jgi:two-component system response regulator YesN
MIVDDEILIREGLTRMIAKESDHFNVIGCFSDGKEALERLPFLHIDVVITDIRMPEVDGLTLIKELKASHPHIRSILMSGYTEFNYAREAIRYSAVDYMLKPINKEQLFELLYRLDKENQHTREQEIRVRARILHSYLHSEDSSGFLLPELSLPLPYYVVFFHTGSSSSAVLCVTDHVKQEKNALYDCLSINDRLQVLIWYFTEAPDLDELKRVCTPLFTVPAGHSVHIGSSHIRTHLTDLKTAYSEAKLACNTGIYSDTKFHYANIQELVKPVTDAPESLVSDWESFTGNLQILNTTRVIEWIQQQFTCLQSRYAEPEAIIRMCRLIEDTAVKELQEFDDVHGLGAREALEREMLNCMSFRQMEHLFLSAITTALEGIRNLRLEMGDKAVEHVKRWISANYNQHAELNMLANMVFLTPSYLSKLFKQEIGLTLTEYITEIRIKKAKQLLRNEPNMKVHTIGAEVGYPDPAYFNKLFKRVVGITPSEYKKILH